MAIEYINASDGAPNMDTPLPNAAASSTGVGWKALGGHALGAAGPAAIGLAAGIPAGEAATAMALPFTGPFAPLVGGAVGFGVGGLAAYGAGRAQDALLNRAPGLQQALGQDPATRAQQEQDFPKSSMVGKALPDLAAFRPTLSALNPLSLGGYLSKTVTTGEKVGGIVNAAVGGGTDLASQMNSDQPVDLTQVALAAGLGALGQRETGIGRRIAGVGRMAIPSSLQARIDAHTASLLPAPNDGTSDVGAAGGAGAEADTSSTNQPLTLDMSPGNAAPPLTQQGTLDLQGGRGGQAASRDVINQQQALPLDQPTEQGTLPLGSGPENQYPPPASVDLAAPPAPPDRRALAPPIAPDAQMSLNAPGLDSASQAVSANFSSMQVLRTLRDVAGTPEKPATPDSYMLQLAHGISQRINIVDPDAHAVHGYLNDQMQTLVAQDDQLKEHVIDNQVLKTNSPQAALAQTQRAKDLDAAQVQTAKQIKTLGAAQDAMPTLVKQLATHTGNAQNVQVRPAFEDALTRAKARIAAGDTGGAKIGEPAAPAASTADQMRAKNASDQARSETEATAAATAHSDSVVAGNQALHTAKVRDDILNGVLDDATTLNPMERFRAALAQAKIKDMSITDAEGQKISRWEGLRETLGAPHTEWSPNEMDPNLVKEAKPAALKPAQPQDRRQLTPDESSPQRRASDVAAEPMPAAEEPTLPAPEAPAPTQAQTVSSLGDVVKAADKQGAIDKGTSLKLLHELTKPDPNLDMVRATVAKGAKRLEAQAKAKPAQAPLAREPGDALAQGMSKAEVQAAVNEHLAGWTGAPKVQVHQDASTLPENLQAGHATDLGTYVPQTKTVHMIADNLSNKADVHATLFHEALGHFGMRKAFGDRLNQVLGDVYRTNPRMRALADAWVARHGADYPDRSPAALAKRGIDEAFAERSEAGPQAGSGGVKGVVERVKGFVRDTARRMGVKLNYSDADVQRILSQAHTSVTDGTPGPAAAGSSREVPLSRKSGIGGDLKQRVENLTKPDVMKQNAKDEWVNLGGKGRRAAMSLMDLGWLTESADKMFTVGGVEGQHLMTDWRSTNSSKDAEKKARTEQGRIPHDLYVGLPDQGQQKVAKLLLEGSDAAIEVRTPRTAEGPAPDLEAGLRKQYEALLKPEKAAYDAMRQEFADQLAEKRALFKSQVSDIYAPEDGESAQAQKQKAADKASAHAQIEDKLKELPGYFPMARFGDFTVISKSPEWKTANTKLEALKMKYAKATPEEQKGLKAEVKTEQSAFDKMQDAHYEVRSFERESEQKNHAAAMTKKGWDVTERLAPDFNASTDGVSGSFMKAINDHLDARAELHPDQKDGLLGLKSMMNQLMLEHMPAASAMKSQMLRKGVAGYSTDVPRVYAAMSQRNAGFLNEIKYGMKTSDLLAKMQAQAKVVGGNRPQEIYNHLKSMFDLSKQYANNPITNWLSQASYAYYLGGSASFSVMHMMQTPMVTWGMLFGQHGGMKSAGALMSAAKEVMGNYKKFHHDGTEEQAGKTPGEQMSIRNAVQHNLIGGTHASGFMNAALSEASPLTKLGRGIMSVAAFMPHHVERANRLLTNLAAYRLAIAHPEMMAGVHDSKSEHYVSDLTHRSYIKEHLGYDPKYQAFAKANPGLEEPEAQAAFALANPDRVMTKEQLMAARYAEKITGDSHVDYSASASPKLLQSISKLPVLSMAMQFQKYQFGMIKVLGQNANRAFDQNLNPSERRVAQRTLAGVLGMHGAVTGMMGLPGAGIALLAANAYHKAFGDPNDPFDAETSFRKTLAGLLGKDAGDVAARGLLYAPGVNKVMPADITDRLGMGDIANPFNATRIGEKINSDSLMSYIGTQLTGPVGSILGNMTDAYKFQHEGQYQRALEEIAPKAIRDLSKATRYAMAGVTTGTGMPVVPASEIKWADIAAQVIGFTPQKSREAYAQRSAMTGAKTDLEDRRNVIIKQMIAGFNQGDTTDARDMMNEFNASMRAKGLRNQVLNMSTVMKAIQERRVAMRRLQGGTSASPKDRALRDAFGDYSGVTDPEVTD